MQATNRADPRAAGFIVLHEAVVAEILCEEVSAKGFRKVAPFIADMVRSVTPAMSKAWIFLAP